MATFEITAPDGGVYHIDGETQAGAVAALKKLLKPAEGDSTSIGLLKSAGVGLAKGAIGMAQFPAQVGNWLADRTVTGIERMRGVPEQEIEANRTRVNQVQANDYLNPLNLRRNIEEVTGPFREPQNTPERYIDTTAQFLAATPIGGAPGMGAKLIGATTGGLLSEAGGEAAQKYIPEAEPYARLAGGLLGAGAPALMRRVVTPNPVSAERQGLLNTMKQEGVDLTAGQATGSNTLKYAESELGGGKGASFMEQQGEQFTKAALKRAGIDANRATPEVMDKAFTRIGNEFDGLAAKNNIPPDAQLATDVASVVTDYAALVPSAARAPVITNLANDMLNAAQQGLGGKAYQAFRSRLDRMARNNKDPQLAEALRGIKTSLDDSMERHLSNTGSPDLAEWQEVRNQYRNIIVLEQAATSAGEKAAEGLLSPSALRTATVQNHGRRNYGRGKGDFADLARAGEATMKPLPQSGTAPRTAARAMGTSIPTLIGAALGSTTGTPLGLVAGGMAGAALPFAVGRGLLSGPGRKYLANQLLGPGKLTLRQRGTIGLLGSAPQLTGPNR